MIKVKNKWISYVLLLLVYSIIYFVYSGSFPWNFAHQLPGNIQGDMSQFLWNVHHFGEWVDGKEAYFHTNLLYAPYGTSLQYHTYSHLMTAISYFLGNSFLGINLVIWLHYILSGLGAFLLARHFKLNWRWAFLAGLFFAFIPYKFAHYSAHFNLQQTAVIPFLILFFFRTFPLHHTIPLFSKFSFSKLLLLILLGVLSILSSYIYTVFLFFFGIAYLIYYITFRLIPNKWMRFVLLIGLTIITTELVPYLLSKGLQDHGAFWWADDMGKFLTPNWNSKFYHWATPDLYSHYNRLTLKHNDCFLGFSFPLLFLATGFLFLLKKDKQLPYPVIGFLVLFFFMLTSPKILIFKTQIGYFPTSLYHFVPLINNARIPERFIIMLALFLPIFCFSMLAFLTEKKPFLRKIIPLVLFVLLIIEFNQNHIDKAKKNDIPTWATQLASLPKGNVLPLPTGVNDGNIASGNFESKHLYLQSVYQQNLIGGYISRIEEELRAIHLKNPVMQSILSLSKGEDAKQEYNNEQINQFIKQFEIRYILISDKGDQYRNFVSRNFQHRIQREIKSGGASIYILTK